LTLVLSAALLFPVLALLAAAQTNNIAGAVAGTKEKDELEKLKKDAVENYKFGFYDEAFRLSQLALTLGKKLDGEEGKEVAIIYFNIGKILKMKKLNKEALGNFERSLAIFEGKFPDDKRMIVANYSELGFLNDLEGKKAEAEKFFVTALERSQSLDGAEGEIVLPHLNNLANFYEAQKEMKKAEPLLWRAAKLANKLYGYEDSRAENASDRHSCFLHTYFSNEERKQIPNRNENEDGTKEPKITGSVINGKAKRLEKPAFPLRGFDGPSGTVWVRITIGKSGEILSAKAFCGPRSLWGLSELAARRSEFAPTTLDGKPVVVSGIIVYNYQ